MKLTIKIIFYLYIISICIACSNSKISLNNELTFNDKEYLLYDTNRAMMDVYFYPENFDDYFNYTYQANYYKSRPIDSYGYKDSNDSTSLKVLGFYLKENLITQKIYKYDKLESEGRYYLNTKVYTSKVPIYNRRGNETNKLDVTYYQKAFRNGKWEYYEDGVKSKVETWDMGKIDTVIFLDK